MPDKLTDNEIIKALKEILEIMLTMGDLQKSATISKAIYLINRLQAENERLRKCREDEVYKIVSTFDKVICETKAEAYKEFAERLKARDGFDNHNFDDCASILVPEEYRKGRDEKVREIWNTIDNLLKEMVGEDNES